MPTIRPASARSKVGTRRRHLRRPFARQIAMGDEFGDVAVRKSRRLDASPATRGRSLARDLGAVGGEGAVVVRDLAQRTVRTVEIAAVEGRDLVTGREGDGRRHADVHEMGVIVAPAASWRSRAGGR